jgi:phage regulator Rha-like protein
MTLVEVKGKELLASTITIAMGVKLEHRAVMSLVKKYSDRLNKYRVMTFEMSKAKTGRPVKYAWLNEKQATFLITLMKNSEIVVEFKEKLTDEYYRLKEALQMIAVNQKNAAWIEKRQRGKISRLEETNSIKQYVDYAKSQGSKNAEKYYITISKMENKALFFLEQKFPNVRDALAGHQLETIANADRIVAKQLKQCVDDGRPYKEGYQMAKTAIESFAELIGKSLVPSLELIEG